MHSLYQGSVCSCLHWDGSHSFPCDCATISAHLERESALNTQGHKLSWQTNFSCYIPCPKTSQWIHCQHGWFRFWSVQLLLLPARTVSVVRTQAQFWLRSSFQLHESFYENSHLKQLLQQKHTTGLFWEDWNIEICTWSNTMKQGKKTPKQHSYETGKSGVSSVMYKSCKKYIFRSF